MRKGCGEMQGGVGGSENVFSELHHHLRTQASWVALRAAAADGERCGAPVVATNEVHYHVAERRRLYDVLVAIRHRATLEAARPTSFQLRAPPEGGDAMRPLFKGH